MVASNASNFIKILLFLCFLPLIIDCNSQAEEETLPKDYIICRHCGSDVSLTNFFIQKPSPLALSTVNQTIFQTKNILVQDLENPFGIRFRIVLLKVATCSRAGNWVNDTSWFPGYSWKLCMCPVCSVHIGWMYEPNETAVKSLAFPSDRGFYALLLNHVLSESYVNSLLMTDTYKSEL